MGVSGSYFWFWSLVIKRDVDFWKGFWKRGYQQKIKKELVKKLRGAIENYKNKSALENENEPSKKFKKSRSKK